MVPQRPRRLQPRLDLTLTGGGDTLVRRVLSHRDLWLIGVSGRKHMGSHLE